MLFDRSFFAKTMLLYMRKCICDYMCIFGAVATILRLSNWCKAFLETMETMETSPGQTMSNTLSEKCELNMHETPWNLKWILISNPHHNPNCWTRTVCSRNKCCRLIQVCVGVLQHRESQRYRNIAGLLPVARWLEMRWSYQDMCGEVRVLMQADNLSKNRSNLLGM